MHSHSHDRSMFVVAFANDTTPQLAYDMVRNLTREAVDLVATTRLEPLGTAPTPWTPAILQ